MSDIFEIKTAQIDIKIGDKVFALKDPKFIDKINIKKQMDALGKEKGSMDDTDYLIKAYEMNKKIIKMFIPEMSDKYIDNEIPSSALELLIEKIGEITQNKFGAVIEKTEKK